MKEHTFPNAQSTEHRNIIWIKVILSFLLTLAESSASRRPHQSVGSFLRESKELEVTGTAWMRQLPPKSAYSAYSTGEMLLCC